MSIPIPPPREADTVSDRQFATSIIENRLLDLWSITDFVQPNYLGNQQHFHETYEPRPEAGEDVVMQQVARRRLSAKLRPLLLRRRKQQVEIGRAHA
mgnify:CR=1 FL=1